MPLSRPAGVVVKPAIAIFIGIPGTAVYGLLSYLAISFGGESLHREGLMDALNRSGSLLYNPALLTFWGLGGFIGLAGFWTWVFAPARTLQRIRLLLAFAILIGVIALAPLAFWVRGDWGLLKILSFAGVAVGTGICAQLVLPSLPSMSQIAGHRKAVIGASLAVLGWMVGLLIFSHWWGLRIVDEGAVGAFGPIAGEVVRTAPNLVYFFAVGLISGQLIGPRSGAISALLAAAVSMCVYAALTWQIFYVGLYPLATAMLAIDYLLPLLFAVAGAAITRFWRNTTNGAAAT